MLKCKFGFDPLKDLQQNISQHVMKCSIRQTTCSW